MKVIKVDDNIHKKLFKLRLDFNLKSLNDVISKMHKLIHKLSLMKDFEIMVQSEVKVGK